MRRAEGGPSLQISWGHVVVFQSTCGELLVRSSSFLLHRLLRARELGSSVCVVSAALPVARVFVTTTRTGFHARTAFHTPLVAAGRRWGRASQ